MKSIFQVKDANLAGAALPEYLLTLVLVAGVTIGALNDIGMQVNAIYGKSADAFMGENYVPGDGGPSGRPHNNHSNPSQGGGSSGTSQQYGETDDSDTTPLP